MARAKKAKKSKPEETGREPLDPQKVYELFRLPGPYEPPPPPIGVKGFVTFWDPGISTRRIYPKRGELFYPVEGVDKPAFTKEADSWRWKQIRLEPIGVGTTFAEQKKKKKLLLGEPASAREVVPFLVLHFLATGERLEIDRLRCEDVMPLGRRVIVGPFHERGRDIANVSDAGTSPGTGLCAVCVPRRK